MIDDIDRRTAEREAALLEKQSSQRRLAEPRDYLWDKAQCQFWDLKDGTLHEAIAVDASIPTELWRLVTTPGRGNAAPRERLAKPSGDIMRIEQDQTVEHSTWWPGRPQIIDDWFVSGDGMWPAPGRRIYNQYRPIPDVEEGGGEAALAQPWIDHVRKLWPAPEEHEYFFDFCAHMLQRPEEKCNAGVVLSGEQGSGKDSALQPVRDAIGSWNCKDVEPDMLFKDFRPWLQTLMLVVNEAKPADDEFSAISLYNTWKPWMAAPPFTLPVNDKHVKIRHIVNLLRVFITTNNWLDLYIPADDRRMFIMHTTLRKGWHEAEGDPDYFKRMWSWINAGGSRHVAAWLAARDLSAFDPNREVAKTDGWRAVAQTWTEQEDGVAYALDRLGRPEVLFGAELLSSQFDFQDDVAAILKSPRKAGHRLGRAGYQIVAPEADRWQFKSGEAVYRSRLAFATNDAARDREGVAAKLRERGERLAAAKAAAGRAANDEPPRVAARF